MVGPQTVQSRNQSSQMAPQQTVLLAVLGATQLGYGSVGEIMETAKHVASADWQPTGDVIASCIRDAIEAELVRAEVEDGLDGRCRLQMTDVGTERLFEMLLSSVPVAGGVGRVCVAMRLCFLGALLPEARSECVAAVRRDYERELAELRRRCSRCPCRNPFVHLWMDREIDRIEWEMAWLDRFQSEAAGPSAVV